MGMKSGELGLSEILQNQVSLTIITKLEEEIDESKRKGKEAEEEELLIDYKKFKRLINQLHQCFRATQMKWSLEFKFPKSSYDDSNSQEHC